MSYTCCCCFQLHQGFVNIIYLDIARVFWGVILSIVTYTQGRNTRIDQAFNIITLLSIVIQTSLGVLVLSRGIPRNNLTMVRNYRRGKQFFIFSNTVEKVVLVVADCLYFYEQEGVDEASRCDTQSLTLSLVIGVVWNLVEFYFYRVVTTFTDRFGQPAYQQHIRMPRYQPRNGARKPRVLEVKGIHLPNFNRRSQLFLDNGVVLSDQKTNNKGEIIHSILPYESQSLEVIQIDLTH